MGQKINSNEYWIERYQNGGNSGAGSYNKLAEFKAEVINGIIEQYSIQDVIEFGCGDGNQLSLMTKTKSYLGLDVSPLCIKSCSERFHWATFRLMKYYESQKGDLSLSLDVIYHLLEDEVFETYMRQLFDSSNKMVLIYSSDHSDNSGMAEWVKHREFTKWVDENRPGWILIRRIKNKYPYKKGMNSKQARHTSVSDFYLYAKA